MERDRLEIKKMHQVHKRTNKDGFTLIEVLIAMLILSIGLLAIASMQITAIKQNSHAIHLTQATALIEDILDDYKTMPYDYLVNDSYQDGIFTCDTQVQPNTPVPGLKKVTVTISWQSGNKPKGIAFSTIISK